MIPQKQISRLLTAEYKKNNLTIGTLGGHSALDICNGAKKYGFKTVAVCEKGREKTYAKYYKSRNGKGIIDEIILVDKFNDIVGEDVQKRLRKLNTIFVHNRYFWVYCNYADIENKFLVPIFGTRDIVKLEERDVPRNQYFLLEKAGIRIPKIFKNPKDIDRLVIVKVNDAHRKYERGFFLVKDYKSYQKEANLRIRLGEINQKGLKNAIIEEFIIGALVNFNYFYSPLTSELELLGTDTRRQTNLDGFLRLPSETQIEYHLSNPSFKPTYIETGHIAVTVKESLLEKIFLLGEKFVSVTKKEHPPGIIGPFALQGAVVSQEKKEDIIIFDVSLRIPGSPGIRFTPYSSYLYGESLSYGERIAMEIKRAVKENKLDIICT